MSKTGTKIFLLVMGIIGLVAGIFMTFLNGKGYVETTAVIDRIDEIYLGTDADGSPDYTHDVYVTYTVDGQTYSGKTDFYNGSYKEGKEIKIFYDPNDPTKITGDSKGFGIYLIVVGAVLTLAGLFLLLFRR